MFCDGKRVVVSAMLYVDRVLQHSGALCCTWTPSCYIRELYVARGHRLATFRNCTSAFNTILKF